MDDMDDPMAKASPMPKGGGYTNGYDKPPSMGWGRGPLGDGRMLPDMSMDDDIVDPIGASMEMTDSRYEAQPPRRPSPVSSYQSDPYDQRHTTSSQQYNQPPPQSYMQPASEPTWEWQYGTVRLDKKPNCGFGLAVIGGIDKPTPSGDVSIIVSDILPNGPADDRLKINDRLLQVNGISMNNVDHAVAVGALRNAGGSVVIEYRRKVQVQAPITKSQTLPAYSQPPPSQHNTPGGQSGYSPNQSYYTPQGSGQRSLSQPPTNRSGSQLSLTHSQSSRSAQQQRESVTLTKSRNEGFGMQLGWKLFVQGMSEYGVAANQGLSKGDTIVKINNYPVETLSLADAKRLIQTSGNTLNLEVIREPQMPAFSTPTHTTRSVDRLDRLSIGRGDEGGYGQPQQQQQGGYRGPQQSGGYRQMPQEDLPPLQRAQNEMLSFDQDDPLNSAPPPRPPLPGGEQQTNTFSMPPPRPPSPGRQEFMGITDEVVEGEERLISFKKGRSVGLQVIGGNDSGVYIGRIQPNSNAYSATGPRGDRIRVGDRIVDVS